MAKPPARQSSQPEGGEGMTAEDAAVAIQKATAQTPQLLILREKLIEAIEKQEGGMDSLLRAIRSKMHEG